MCGFVVESAQAELYTCTSFECGGNGMAARFPGSRVEAEGCSVTGNRYYWEHVRWGSGSVEGVQHWRPCEGRLHGRGWADDSNSSSSKGDGSGYGVADEGHLVLEELTVDGVCQSLVLP